MTSRVLLAALLLGCSGVPVGADVPDSPGEYDADISHTRTAIDISIRPLPEASAVPPPRLWRIYASSSGYVPSELVIRIGDRVRWENFAGFRTDIQSGFMCVPDAGFGPESLPFETTFAHVGPIAFYDPANCLTVGVVVVTR